MIYSILFTLFLIYFSKMFGRYLLDFFKLNALYLDFGVGIVGYFSILFITSIPFIYFKSLFDYYLLFQSILLVTIFIFLVFKHKLFIPSKEDLGLLLCTSIVYLIYFFIDFNKGGDFQYYLSLVAQNITNPTGIYNFDAWTGINPYEMYIWYKFVPFEAIMSFFTILSGGNALVYSIWGIPLLLVYSFVYINFQIIKTLYYASSKFKGYHFLLLVILILIFSLTGSSENNFHFYNNNSFFNLPYAGKSLLYYFVIPFSFLIMYMIFKIPQAMGAYFKILTLIGFMAVCVSSTGLFLQGTFLISFLVIILVLIENNKEYIVNLYTACIPLLIYLILSLSTKDSIIFKIIPLLLIFVYLVGLYVLKRYNLFRNIKRNRFYVIFGIFMIYLASCLVRIISYTNTIQFSTFKDYLYSDFLSYEPIFILMIIAMTLICLDQKISFAEQIFYIIFNGIYIILFLNPICSIFVAKFITSVDVYWRLFYCTNFIFLLIYLIDKLVKREISSKLLRVVCVGTFSVSILYIKNPIMEYNKVNFSDKDYNLITKMNNEVGEISKYLSQLGEVNIVVPTEFYREGVRGIAPNLNLFITVYDDRHPGKYAIDKQLMLHFLEYGPDNTEWFIEFVKQFKIDYLVMKKDVQGIFNYPDYFEVIKKFNNYVIIKMKGDLDE